MSGYFASLLSVIGINMILALGLNIITGFCGQVSLGHAAFYGIGAYTAAYLSKLGVPLLLTLPAGTAMAGLIGVVVGLTSLRVRHDFLAVTTMGIGFIFLGFVRKQKWLGGELGISGAGASLANAIADAEGEFSMELFTPEAAVSRAMQRGEPRR